MAREIPVNKIGDFAEEQYNKLLAKVVITVDSRLKRASPVDTGRFRASWQVGENDASGPGEPAGKKRYGRRDIQRINYASTEGTPERVGNKYYVHNNLPYAEFLADGSSPQAEPGWIQGVAKDVQNAVSGMARTIANES